MTPPKPNHIVPLCQLTNGQEADFFVLLADKESGRTKDGKPFYRVVFCDAKREVSFPIWNDSSLFLPCRDEWKVGEFYKIRAVYKDGGGYGPKIEIQKMRPVAEFDSLDGFSPNLCRPSSPVDPDLMFDELLGIVKTQIEKGPLQKLIQKICKEYRPAILETAASRMHHHAYFGGLLEHTLSVVKLSISIFEHFQATYPQLKKTKTISKSLVVAGAILHDFGKLVEMKFDVVRPRHTLEGELIGHFLLGRDLVQKFANDVELDAKTQTLLEHIIITHSRFSDWGTPKPPTTLEAMIVHYADYAESTFASAIRIEEIDDSSGLMTSKKGPFGIAMLKIPEFGSSLGDNDGKAK